MPEINYKIRSHSLVVTEGNLVNKEKLLLTYVYLISLFDCRVNNDKWLIDSDYNALEDLLDNNKMYDFEFVRSYNDPKYITTTDGVRSDIIFKSDVKFRC